MTQTDTTRPAQKPQRICIVTPGAIGSNPRVVKEADALQEAGFDVTVISTRTLDLVDRRDDALLRRVTWKSRRVDLRGNFKWKSARAAQFMARSVGQAFSTPRFASISFSAFTPALYSVTASTPADLYIAHYPAALPVAAAAARRHKAILAFDAEDFHPGDYPDVPSYNWDRRLVREIEQRHLPSCAFMTAASPGIADAYAEQYGIAKPRVILNVFPLSQMPHSGPTQKGIEPLAPSIYWFSQTIGPDRGLECAVQAIGQAASRPQLFLRGSPVAGYADRLMSIAAEVRAADRLHFLAPADPDDMERLASGYDLGLAMETGGTRARDRCLTNKLFSYLLAGVPPLMSNTPAQVAFAIEAGLKENTFPIGDARALADLVDHFLSSPTRLAAARAKVSQLAIERYNWDNEKHALVETVRSALAERSHTRGPSSVR